MSGRKPLRKPTDDQCLRVPGQGSQAIGMGKALADQYPAARASRGGRRARRSCPTSSSAAIEDQLTLTANTQPALMAVSLAAHALSKPRASPSSSMPLSWPAIRSANIRRWPPRRHDGDRCRPLLRTRGNAMQEGGAGGRGRHGRAARARLRDGGRRRQGGRPGRCLRGRQRQRPPARWWCRAASSPSSAPSTSPDQGHQAPCCSTSRRPSIAN